MIYAYIYVNETFIFLKIFFLKKKNIENIFSLNCLSKAVTFS